MKLYSWNVNGIRSCVDKGALADFLAAEKPDILCLQETRARRDQAQIDLPDYQEHWCSAARPGYSGTAIFVRNHIPAQEKSLHVKRAFQDAYGDALDEGRLLTLELENFYLVTVYTPNVKHGLERLELRHQHWDPFMLEYLTELEQTKPVVICGDFNVAHTEIDLAYPKQNLGNAGFTDEERQGFDRYLEHGLIDTFRTLHPHTTDAYTWWTWRANCRARNIGWRIDYFLISEQLKPHLKGAAIYPQITGSDHCPISITMEF